MAQRAIHFWHRGRIVTVSDASPQQTVLQWLRASTHSTGTKEGCGEGDCGACTVVIASRDDGAPEGIRLQAVNSCIQFTPTLDGKALFAIEDLAHKMPCTAGPRDPCSALHPVQTAMLREHGSQCGFCTPGILMSLWADYDNRKATMQPEPSRDEITDTLSGNLCRCTGYRPIIAAAQAAWQEPEAKLDRAALRAALDRLKNLASLTYAQGKQTFFAPRSIHELSDLFSARPHARLLAGSTDVGLWVNKQLRDLGDIIYLGEVKELRQISTTEAPGQSTRWLEIGAAVSLSDAFSALISHEPQWTELAQRFASVPIRNAGTLGGNIANGSPIGDSMPALIVLGSRVLLQRGVIQRELALEDFYIGYQKTALHQGELVRAIRVPIPAATSNQKSISHRIFRTWKISKRRDQDISAVCAAFSLGWGKDNCLNEVRIAYGGMAATPKRARAAESALQGRILSEHAIRAAMQALTLDFQPLDDMRATAAYRMQTAQNLLWRLWLEQSGGSLLRIHEVSA